jgi:hypothetical protein
VTLLTPSTADATRMQEDSAPLQDRSASPRPELRRRRTGERISVDDAATRIAAYVYGNVAVLTALATITQEEAGTGSAALLVVGVAVSTFLAHALAHGIGRRLHADTPLTASDVAYELRDCVPILTSALLPTLLLALAWLTSVPAVWAQVLAGLWLVVRLALVGSLVARYRGVPTSWRIVLSGVVLAVLGSAVTLAKVVLNH